MALSIPFLTGPAPWWVLRGDSIAASLDFDFASGRYYQAGQPAGQSPGNLVTTSRASVAYEDDLAGNWIPFPSNTLRVTNKGALIEEARTNSIRNDSMQGAVPGSPGILPDNWAGAGLSGLTQTINAIGAINSVEYIEIRLTGTTTGVGILFPMEAAGVIAASSGQTWASSVFGAIAAGTTSGITGTFMSTAELNSDGTVLAFNNVNILALNNTLARFSAVKTLAQATTAFVRPYIYIACTNGAAVDITYRIGWPQLELGAFSTSPIRTTNAAVTRAADNDNNKIAVAAQTAVISAITASGIGANNQVIWQWDDGTANNRIRLIRNTSRVVQAIVTSGGTQQAALSLGTVNDNTAFKVAFAWAANDFAAMITGGTIQTSGSGSIPTGLTTQRLGSDNAGNQWDGYLKRQTLFPARQPNSLLSAAVNQ